MICLIIVLSSCSENKQQSFILVDKSLANNAEEHYVDSTIGVRGKYKIDLKKFRTDSVYVEIKLYKKDLSNWKLVQNFHFLKNGVLTCDVEIKDYNNDGLNDCTFKSSIAARGANEIKKLFIFNEKEGKLTFIKNSEDFPNLQYNEDLNCIDAFRVYGGTQSVFAKIEGDSLKEYASVELFDKKITIITTAPDGSEHVIRNETYEGDSYIRFKNFSPLEEYKGNY
ncbi:hypothetical protein CHU92_05680 [Flavobacterium cyanobacteriorum]|uniref:Uncharacterized protein n=2 Tax=Flavobacterium cyanobacteriorum TaxID=2022802 RepID=A0A255ZA80_9FLAO|nr:hypothetical protein CHU92_05680 [Flavobacterium cyanobacteriorum]